MKDIYAKKEDTINLIKQSRSFLHWQGSRKEFVETLNKYGVEVLRSTKNFVKFKDIHGTEHKIAEGEVVAHLGMGRLEVFNSHMFFKIKENELTHRNNQ